MKTPKLRYHKASKRYVVTVNGKDVYLGYDQAEAQIQYHEMMANVAAGIPAIAPPDPDGLFVCELIERYVLDREQYYKRNPQAFERGKAVLKVLNRTFGHFRPGQFGMIELRQLRDELMKPNGQGRRRCRNEINRLMGEMFAFWKWCVSMELVSVELYQKYITLEPLKKGRCDAPESSPVTSVPMGWVRAVQANVNSSVSAMIDLQLLTGARPGEIVRLKAEDIDRTGDVWSVTLAEHKTAYRGKQRVIYFGPKAQEVLKPFFLRRRPKEFLFQPVDAGTFRAEKAATHRRLGQMEYRKTDREVGPCYDVASYRRAISRACESAEVPHWHPHQLRHTAATEVRKQYSAEVARAVLGHTTLNATEIYAEVDAGIAKRVAGEIG